MRACHNSRRNSPVLAYAIVALLTVTLWIAFAFGYTAALGDEPFLQGWIGAMIPVWGCVSCFLGGLWLARQ